MALKTFTLSKKDQAARQEVYKDIEHMVQERERQWPHFAGEKGSRTLIQYIDNSDKRLNAYTPSRDAQGKESWQSNFFDPITRNKLKAFVAGVALDVPEIHYRAVNRQGNFSAKRAELIKQLVRHSRLQGNPQLDIFFEAWECAGKGTVVKFDGYLKTKYERKFIKAFDLETGEIETETREAEVDDKPVDWLVPLPEFFIWDFQIFDVQDQPKLAWIQHYNSEQLEQEFGQYKNFKNIHDAATVKRFRSTTESFFLEAWEHRVAEEDDFEVIRYFNKFEDQYEIWVNGVPVLRAPLLWGKTQKMYPFSKTILEPFTGYNFFYGKSLPSILEGIQDLDNTIKNTMVDKLYRSMTPPMLVGLENKDLLDVESELVNQDNKIYVPNVNAVKPMPYQGVQQGELAMLEVVARSSDLATIDSTQQGVQGKGVTAREALIADERARQLKGTFFMFLQDLWLQKTRIRIQNILMNYMTPKLEKVVNKQGVEQIRDALTIFNIPDAEFSDGSVGILGVQIARNKGDRLSISDIEAREDTAEQNGLNYKLIAVTSDYLDDWDFDFELVTSTIFNQDRLRKENDIMEKMERMALLFPEWFATNKEKLFKEMVDIYQESIDDYKKPQQQSAPEQQGDGSLLGLENATPNPSAQGTR